MNHRVVLVVAVLLVAGCRGVPEREDGEGTFLADRRAAFGELDRWQTRGRLAVSDGQRGGSANFDWVDLADGYTVRLRNGQGRWVLDVRPGFAALSGTRVGRRTAAEPAPLVSQALGWEVPVDYLRDWLRGLPGAGDAVTAYARDGSVKSIRYDGWQVEYQRFDTSEGVLLPIRLEATSGPYRVRVAISDWRLAPETPEAKAALP